MLAAELDSNFTPIRVANTSIPDISCVEDMSKLNPYALVLEHKLGEPLQRASCYLEKFSCTHLTFYSRVYIPRVECEMCAAEFF